MLDQEFFEYFRSFSTSWYKIWSLRAKKDFSERDVVSVLEMTKRHASNISQTIFRTLALEKRILFASKWGTLEDPPENKGKRSKNINIGLPHSGMFAGSCLDKAQVGDRIAIIPGLSLPLILRPRECGYQVVGPAHIPVLRDYFRIYFMGKSDPKWEAIVLT